MGPRNELAGNKAGCDQGDRGAKKMRYDGRLRKRKR